MSHLKLSYPFHHTNMTIYKGQDKDTVVFGRAVYYSFKVAPHVDLTV